MVRPVVRNGTNLPNIARHAVNYGQHYVLMADTKSYRSLGFGLALGLGLGIEIGIGLGL